MSLEGMRIDEILSLNIINYDFSKRIINTNRTKGSKKRVVTLRKETVRALEDYIFVERNGIESEIGLSDELFLNLKRGPSYGRRLQYKNVLQVLKMPQSVEDWTPR